MTKFMIYKTKTGKLDEEVVVAKNAITTQHDAMSDKTQTKNVKFYNLDMIISNCKQLVLDVVWGCRKIIYFSQKLMWGNIFE